MKKLAQCSTKGMDKEVSVEGGWGNMMGRTGDIQVTEKGGDRKRGGRGGEMTDH